MGAPIVMHLAGEIYWRGPDGKDFVWWPLDRCERVQARFAANGWTDLSEPLGKAIACAKAYHEQQGIAA